MLGLSHDGSLLLLPCDETQLFFCFHSGALQWGTVDAEIQDPSVENPELRCSRFKAWSRSVHSHAYYAYCQGFLP